MAPRFTPHQDFDSLIASLTRQRDEARAKKAAEQEKFVQEKEEERRAAELEQQGLVDSPVSSLGEEGKTVLASALPALIAGLIGGRRGIADAGESIVGYAKGQDKRKADAKAEKIAAGKKKVESLDDVIKSMAKNKFDDDGEVKALEARILKAEADKSAAARGSFEDRLLMGMSLGDQRIGGQIAVDRAQAATKDAAIEKRIDRMNKALGAEEPGTPPAAQQDSPPSDGRISAPADNVSYSAPSRMPGIMLTAGEDATQGSQPANTLGTALGRISDPKTLLPTLRAISKLAGDPESMKDLADSIRLPTDVLNQITDLQMKVATAKSDGEKKILEAKRDSFLAQMALKHSAALEAQFVAETGNKTAQANLGMEQAAATSANLPFTSEADRFKAQASTLQSQGQIANAPLQTQADASKLETGLMSDLMTRNTMPAVESKVRSDSQLASMDLQERQQTSGSDVAAKLATNRGTIFDQTRKENNAPDEDATNLKRNEALRAQAERTLKTNGPQAEADLIAASVNVQNSRSTLEANEAVGKLSDLFVAPAALEMFGDVKPESLDRVRTIVRSPNGPAILENAKKLKGLSDVAKRANVFHSSIDKERAMQERMATPQYVATEALKILAPELEAIGMTLAPGDFLSKEGVSKIAAVSAAFKQREGVRQFGKTGMGKLYGAVPALADMMDSAGESTAQQYTSGESTRQKILLPLSKSLITGTLSNKDMERIESLLGGALNNPTRLLEQVSGLVATAQHAATIDRFVLQGHPPPEEVVRQYQAGMLALLGSGGRDPEKIDGKIVGPSLVDKIMSMGEDLNNQATLAEIRAAAKIGDQNAALLRAGEEAKRVQAELERRQASRPPPSDLMGVAP